ncbi:MAG: branched-chain amino acid ABC transporter permease, partial [Planctomycetes bacterium]|nr:branched-chain amino acid ABC transporter permease [Planctomycetota bacterium]
FATDWSLISMYILLILVVTFRARGLLGKKSILEN